MPYKINPLPLLTFWLSCLLFNIHALSAQNNEVGGRPEQIRFTRSADQPFIPRVPGTFYSVLVANPAVVEFKKNLCFIFRGQDEGGHDQIGLWKTPLAEADGIYWQEHFARPIIPVSKEEDAFDNNHILDPAAMVKKDSLFVYYTGKSKHGTPEYGIGLSISTDGINFKKYGTNPVINAGIAPEVVYHNGLAYLFYQRLNAAGYWEVFVAQSTNGLRFDMATERRVFGPSKTITAMDSYSVATVRIIKEGDYFFMTYGACKKFTDYPESIGLARSKDLLEWTIYQGNPIFERGRAGSWDEAAIWFPTIRKIRDNYVMWYEGAGTGLGLANEAAQKASVLARETNYGGYLSSSYSQIGIAFFKGRLNDYFK